jgi:hypothetical protein
MTKREQSMPEGYEIEYRQFDTLWGRWHLFFEDCWIGQFYSQSEARQWVAKHG